VSASRTDRKEAATFQDHYSGIADCYGRFRPGYPPELFDHLRALAGEGARVLEVAAGSGQATRGLAHAFPQTIATDASFAQLQRVGAAIGRVVALAEHPPFREESFDLVATAQALHWFRFDPFFPEVERLVAPGGHFAAWTYRFPDFEGALGLRFRALAHEELAAYWPAERRHVEASYTTIPFPEAWQRLQTPHFESTATLEVDDFLGYVGTWSAVVQGGEAGRRALEAFARACRRLWPEGERRTVRWPLTLTVFRVRPSPFR